MAPEGNEEWGEINVYFYISSAWLHLKWTPPYFYFSWEKAWKNLPFLLELIHHKQLEKKNKNTVLLWLLQEEGKWEKHRPRTGHTQKKINQWKYRQGFHGFIRKGAWDRNFGMNSRKEMQNRELNAEGRKKGKKKPQKNYSGEFPCPSLGRRGKGSQQLFGIMNNN